MAGAALRQLGLFPLEALEEAIRRGQRAEIAEENLKVLPQSVQLASITFPLSPDVTLP